jgi:acyl-CoA thioester hydrolase
MLPVSHFEVNYKAPALYDDQLSITTQVTELKGPRLFFHYEIQKDGKLIASATTTLVFVMKSSMRPCPPPEDFVALLKKHAEI